MNLTDLLTYPPRRDIKGMTARLTELKAGDYVSVTFKSEKYGIFNIEGPAIMSESVKTFMVGSVFIETSLKPEKSVLMLRAEGLAGDTTNTDDNSEVLRTVVGGVSHGDIVRATFMQSPHGRFTITGPAVATDDGLIVAVGSWFLANKGEVASRLRKLTVLAEVGTHGVPVPKLITSWESDEMPLIN